MSEPQYTQKDLDKMTDMLMESYEREPLFDAQRDLHLPPKEGEARVCRKCGSPLDGDECRTCGYVESPDYEELPLLLDRETRPSPLRALSMLPPFRLLGLIWLPKRVFRFLKQMR